MPRGMHIAWSEKEIALLLELRDDEGMEWPDIARHLPRRDQQACAQKYHNIEMRERTERGESPAFRTVPNASLIDRDRREELRDQQNLTSRFFGDPPPGYSALDRKRA